MEEEEEVVVISENERYVPGRGWSSKNLLALDPYAYTNTRDKSLRGSTADSAGPPGADWIDASWRVCLDGDGEGWRYAVHFGGNWQPSRSSLTTARSRTWKRRRRRTGGQGGTFILQESSSTKARQIELARTIREVDEMLNAKEVKLSTLDKKRMTAEAKAAAKLSESLEKSGDREAAASERIREDLLWKKILFPGYDPQLCVRGEGVAIAAKSIDLEHLSGQFIAHFHASPDMPQLLFEALGASFSSSGDSSKPTGVSVLAVVQGLFVKSTESHGQRSRRLRAGSFKIRRVSLRAELGISARARWTRSENGIDASFEDFSLRLVDFSSPGVLSKSVASAILSMLKPTIKRSLIEALPPELGLVVLEMKSPLVVAGEFAALAEPSSRVSSARLDDPDSPHAEKARRLCGWTLDQAISYAKARDSVGGPSSLMDAVAYVRRYDDRRELGARIDDAWSQLADVHESTWKWQSLRDAAARLRRRPMTVSLRLPTLAGSFSLFAVHERFWQYVERKAPGNVDVASLRSRRERTRNEISMLSRLVGVGQARLDLRMNRDSFGVKVTEGKVATPSFSGFLELSSMTNQLKACDLSRSANLPFTLKVRPTVPFDLDPLLDKYDHSFQANDAELIVENDAVEEEEEDEEEDGSVPSDEEEPRPPSLQELLSPVQKVQPQSTEEDGGEGGTAIDFEDEGDSSAAWATLAVRRPRIELLVDDEFRESMPAKVPLLDNAFHHSLFALSLDQGGKLIAAGSSHLVSQAACDRVTASATPRRFLTRMRDLLQDVEKLESWWPFAIDATKCADAVDMIDFLLDQVFLLDKDDFASVRFDLEVFASLKTSDQRIREDQKSAAAAVDTVLNASTLNHGLVIHTNLYSTDVLIAIVKLTNQLYRRALFGAASAERAQ